MVRDRWWAVLSSADQRSTYVFINFYASYTHPRRRIVMCCSPCATIFQGMPSVWHWGQSFSSNDFITHDIRNQMYDSWQPKCFYLKLWICLPAAHKMRVSHLNLVRLSSHVTPCHKQTAECSLRHSGWQPTILVPPTIVYQVHDLLSPHLAGPSKCSEDFVDWQMFAMISILICSKCHNLTQVSEQIKKWKAWLSDWQAFVRPTPVSKYMTLEPKSIWISWANHFASLTKSSEHLEGGKDVERRDREDLIPIVGRTSIVGSIQNDGREQLQQFACDREWRVTITLTQLRVRNSHLWRR